MKKLILIIFLILILASCEESFSPKGDFEQKYILNFVLNTNSKLQVATLSKSYDVDGYNPFDNVSDINLDSAEFRLWYKDTVYFMQDTILDREDSSRYPFPVKAFKLDNFQPDYNQDIEIEALLPNGKRLKSETKTAVEPRFGYDSTGFRIPALDGDKLGIYWSNTQPNLIYHPRLRIVYYKASSGANQIFRHPIPLDYVIINGAEIPNYPRPSKSYSANFKQSAIDKAMLEISEGDPNKEDYRILYASFEIITYDKNLSGYYTATNKSPGDLSIRLDEIDFSNIDGGLGFFGSFSKKFRIIFFDDDYIRNFGYRPSY